MPTEDQVERAGKLYHSGAPLADVLEALGLPPSALVIPPGDIWTGGDSVSDEDVTRVLLGERVLSVADRPEYGMMVLNESTSAPLPPGGGGGDDGREDHGVPERDGGS